MDWQKKFGTHIHVSEMMYPSDFGDPLTFDQQVKFFNYDGEFYSSVTLSHLSFWVKCQQLQGFHF